MAYSLLCLTIIACSSGPVVSRCLANAGFACNKSQSEQNLILRPEQQAQLDSLRRILRALADVPSIKWSSKVLRSEGAVSPQRVEEIVDQLMKKDSPLSLEVSDVFKKIQAEDASQIWNIYLKVYDKLMTFSDGYVEIFLRAHQHLVESGVIVDYGIGTGNGSAIISALGPKRQIIGIDGSQEGLEVTKRKFYALSKSEMKTSQPELIFRDLREGKLKSESVAGALMSNVLYALPGADQLPMLKKVFSELKPGGRLVLNDPRDFIQDDLGKLRTFLVDVASSAAKNNSPMTEFDVAFIGAVNLQFLIGGKTKFLSSSELQSLALQAGFQVEKIYDTYYDAGTMLILRKP